jgi:hypothetical protein
VKLSWATASELNNDYFIIQRSLDGKQFENISKVKGNGTTSIMTNYQYLDNINLLLTTHHSPIYYRLVQTDYDGTQSTSQVIAVRFETISSRELSVQPNPFTDQAVLVINNAQAEQATLRITDGNGKTVAEQPIDLIKGETLLDLSQFAAMNRSGVYTVQVTGTTETSTYRVMKAK